MSEPYTTSTVAAAYDEVADFYAQIFADQLPGNPVERGLVEDFGERVRAAGNGVIADLGCGPGRIGEHLRRAGNRVVGVDVSAEMVRNARRRYPELAVYHRSIQEYVAAPVVVFDHALLWFSVIHMVPATIGPLIRQVRQAMAPGGYLLIAFQTTEEPGGEPVPYDHRATPAHRFPLEWMRRVLIEAGTVVHGARVREPGQDERVGSGYVLAQRVPV